VVVVAKKPVVIATVSAGNEKVAMEDVEHHAFDNTAFHKDFLDPPPAYDNGKYEEIQVVDPKTSAQVAKGEPKVLEKKETKVTCSDDKLDSRASVKKLRALFQ
jgi:hypothetical protein